MLRMGLASEKPGRLSPDRPIAGAVPGLKLDQGAENVGQRLVHRTRFIGVYEASASWAMMPCVTS